MLVRDLLLEKKLAPGERKAIQLKLDQLKERLNKLEDYRTNLSIISGGDHPPEVLEKVAELIFSYQSAIKKLDAEIQADQSKEQDEMGNNKRLVRLMNGIQKNCSDAIAIYKKTHRFLYRGTNEDAEAIYGRPYESRAAKDSNQQLSDALNYGMKEAGVKARRDNSIFTGSKGHATGYGRNVYVIFPVNGFHFSWSTTFSDLVLDHNKARGMLDRDKVMRLFEIIHNDATLKHDFQDETNMDDWRPEAVLGDSYGFFGYYNFSRQFRTVMTFAEQGALEEFSEPLQTMKFSALISPKTTMKYFGIRTDDFQAALESNSEVLIHGNYYGVRVDHERSVRAILQMQPAAWY